MVGAARWLVLLGHLFDSNLFVDLLVTILKMSHLLFLFLQHNAGPSSVFPEGIGEFLVFRISVPVVCFFHLLTLVANCVSNESVDIDFSRSST